MTKEYQYLHGDFQKVSKSLPCEHCGKPDWCYRLGELSVCCRNAEPAPGWYRTTKTDKDNKFFYAREQKKQPRPVGKEIWEYPDREGNKLVRVIRIINKDGVKQRPWQESWNGTKWIKRTKHIDRADIPIYRYQEVKEAIAKNIPIIIVEGESCADALWELEIPATTNLGGCKKWRESDSKDLEGATVVIAPDRDKPGIDHALKIAEDFPDAHWLYAPPSSFFWQRKHIPNSQGADIYDHIKFNKATREDILNLICEDSPSVFNKKLLELYPNSQKTDVKSSQIENELTNRINVEQPVTLKAQEALYSDGHYIAMGEKLYKWEETHYEPCDQAYERRRIAQWCKSTAVHLSGEKYKYSWAKASAVEEVWKWLLIDFGVNPSKVNPPGINCLNGTVKIEFLGKTPITKLEPHSPNEYYLYCAEFEYNPTTDETDCNNLLLALDPQHRTIFLRTIAASLNLGYVRSKLGRGVKALLCQGTGSNGKDTLREAISVIFGQSMSNASVADFRQYDQGRKFPLSKLEGSRINWSSENSSFANIDNLQGLKLAITGEHIDIEPKNQPEYSIVPEAVFFFNINEPPLLQGGMDAIKDRYPILRFSKTFKTKANHQMGQLEADPRFRYDPEFLKTRVCPALLNKILQQLPLLLDKGIDYSSTQEDMEAWQRATNHLWEFSQEMGLEYAPGKKMYISDLWDELKRWYLDNEMAWVTLTNSGQEVIQIGDAPRKGDSLIKASNQIFTRFSQLFPKISKGKSSGHHPTRKSQRYIMGLQFKGTESAETQTGEDWKRNSPEQARLLELIDRSSVPNLVNSLNPSKIMNPQTEYEKLGFQGFQADPARDTGFPTGFPVGFQTGSQSTNCENGSFSENNPVRANLLPNIAQNDENQNGSFPNMTLQLNTTVTNTITDLHTDSVHGNTKTQEKEAEIEWVKLKDGRIGNVLQRQGNWLVVRESGMQRNFKVNLLDCEYIHYKGENAPFLESKN